MVIEIRFAVTAIAVTEVYNLRVLGCFLNRECAFGLSGRGRGGSRLPGTHSTQFIGHEVMRLSTYYCTGEAYCAIV